MSKISYETKVEAIRRIEKGEASINSTAHKLGVDNKTVREWIMKYESQGIESLKKRYSKEEKIKAVEEYLSGKGSQIKICKEHKINSTRQLKDWIEWYNGNKDIKERSSNKGEIYMTKGRKTTQEERVEIVAFCIEHGKDYGLTVETHQERRINRSS
ncbi:MAG: helix-turn-helix domain-containing protein [Acutalibacteraceae bacterium]